MTYNNHKTNFRTTSNNTHSKFYFKISIVKTYFSWQTSIIFLLPVECRCDLIYFASQNSKWSWSYCYVTTFSSQKKILTGAPKLSNPTLHNVITTQYQSTTQIPHDHVGLKFDAEFEFHIHLCKKLWQPWLLTNKRIIFVPTLITHTAKLFLKIGLSKLTFCDGPVLYYYCPLNVDAIWSALHVQTSSGHWVIGT